MAAGVQAVGSLPGSGSALVLGWLGAFGEQRAPRFAAPVGESDEVGSGAEDTDERDAGLAVDQEGPLGDAEAVRP